MSSDKDGRIALLLIEAARSGGRDPNLRDAVIDYVTHDSETDCLSLTDIDEAEPLTHCVEAAAVIVSGCIVHCDYE